MLVLGDREKAQSHRNWQKAVQGHGLTQYWIWNHKVMPLNTHTKVCVKPPHNFSPQQKEGTKRPDRSPVGGLGGNTAGQLPGTTACPSKGPQWARLVPASSPTDFWADKPRPLPLLGLGPNTSRVYLAAKIHQKKQGKGQLPLCGLNEHPDAAGLSSALFIKNRFSSSPSPLLAKGSYPTFFSQINEITDLGGSRS